MSRWLASRASSTATESWARARARGVWLRDGEEGLERWERGWESDCVHSGHRVGRGTVKCPSQGQVG